LVKEMNGLLDRDGFIVPAEAIWLGMLVALAGEKRANWHAF